MSRTVEYGPLNWPITARIATEKSNTSVSLALTLHVYEYQLKLVLIYCTTGDMFFFNSLVISGGQTPSLFYIISTLIHLMGVWSLLLLLLHSLSSISVCRLENYRGRDVITIFSTTDDLRFLGIRVRLMQWSWHWSFLMIFPRMSLHCKLYFPILRIRRCSSY